MSRAHDLRGLQFGKLTPIEMLPRVGGVTRWLCRCSCGRETVVRGGNLTNGHTRSCGFCHDIIAHDGYLEYRCKSGRSFLFDAEDVAIIEQTRWCVDVDGYVQGIVNAKPVRLHRLLMNAPQGVVVDHINGDPRDCRKKNLRIASQHQNTMNCKLGKHSTTGYKGVCFDSRRGKYVASIHPDGKTVFLGYFTDPLQAAKAYDQAAIRYFGSYANCNL